jgi:hypothetical protein
MAPLFGERVVVRAVRSGEIEIDADGRIWRTAIRQGLGHNARLGKSGVRLAAVTRRRAEHWLPVGYGIVRLMVDGDRHTALAHRLVWQWFLGDIPGDKQINHINGDKSDNRPQNLELATASENMRHAYRTGLKRGVRGQRSNLAKLPDATVVAIRETYAAGGITTKELSGIYGVSAGHVCALVRGIDRPDESGTTYTQSLKRRDPVTGRFVLSAVGDRQ